MANRTKSSRSSAAEEMNKALKTATTSAAKGAAKGAVTGALGTIGEAFASSAEAAKERDRNAAKTRIVKSGGKYKEGDKRDPRDDANRMAKRERDDRRRGFDKAWSEW